MMVTKFVLLVFAICRLIATVGLTLDPTVLLRLGVERQISVDPSDVERASIDFGGMQRAEPWGVLYPASAEDVAWLVKAAYESTHGFTVSARGHGHSINGQAMTTNGVVIQMSRHADKGGVIAPKVSEKFMYVDVWGGELWIDVLSSVTELRSLKRGHKPLLWSQNSPLISTKSYSEAPAMQPKCPCNSVKNCPCNSAKNYPAICAVLCRRRPRR